MTTYHTTHHATDRLIERFPSLAPVVGTGAHAALWLARVARQAKVIGQQRGQDLMLAVDLPTVGGRIRLCLPVTPGPTGDTWTIRTVLTQEQAQASLAEYDRAHREGQRMAWRARKGFTRPWRRADRGALVALRDAA